MDNDKEANKTGVAGKRSSSKPGDSPKHRRPAIEVNVDRLARIVIDDGNDDWPDLDSKRKNKEELPTADKKGGQQAGFAVNEQGRIMKMKTGASQHHTVDPADNIGLQVAGMIGGLLGNSEPVKGDMFIKELVDFMRHPDVKRFLTNPITLEFLEAPLSFKFDGSKKLSHPKSIMKDAFIADPIASDKSLLGGPSHGQDSQIMSSRSKTATTALNNLQHNIGKYTKQQSKATKDVKIQGNIRSHINGYLVIGIFLASKFGMVYEQELLTSILRREYPESISIRNLNQVDLASSIEFVQDLLKMIFTYDEVQIYYLLLTTHRDLAQLAQPRIFLVYADLNRMDYLLNYFEALNDDLKSSAASKLKMQKTMRTAVAPYSREQAKLEIVGGPEGSLKDLDESLTLMANQYFECTQDNALILSILENTGIGKRRIAAVLLNTMDEHRIIMLLRENDWLMESLTAADIIERSLFSVLAVFDKKQLIDVFNMTVRGRISVFKELCRLIEEGSESVEGLCNVVINVNETFWDMPKFVKIFKAFETLVRKQPTEDEANWLIYVENPLLFYISLIYFFSQMKKQLDFNMPELTELVRDMLKFCISYIGNISDENLKMNLFEKDSCGKEFLDYVFLVEEMKILEIEQIENLLEQMWDINRSSMQTIDTFMRVDSMAETIKKINFSMYTKNYETPIEDNDEFNNEFRFASNSVKMRVLPELCWPITLIIMDFVFSMIINQMRIAGTWNTNWLRDLYIEYPALTIILLWLRFSHISSLAMKIFAIKRHDRGGDILLSIYQLTLLLYFLQIIVYPLFFWDQFWVLGNLQMLIVLANVGYVNYTALSLSEYGVIIRIFFRMSMVCILFGISSWVIMTVVAYPIHVIFLQFSQPSSGEIFPNYNLFDELYRGILTEFEYVFGAVVLVRPFLEQTYYTYSMTLVMIFFSFFGNIMIANMLVAFLTSQFDMISMKAKFLTMQTQYEFIRVYNMKDTDSIFSLPYFLAPFALPLFLAMHMKVDWKKRLNMLMRKINHVVNVCLPITLLMNVKLICLACWRYTQLILKMLGQGFLRPIVWLHLLLWIIAGPFLFIKLWIQDNFTMCQIMLNMKKEGGDLLNFELDDEARGNLAAIFNKMSRIANRDKTRNFLGVQDFLKEMGVIVIVDMISDQIQIQFIGEEIDIPISPTKKPRNLVAKALLAVSLPSNPITLQTLPKDTDEFEDETEADEQTSGGNAFNEKYKQRESDLAPTLLMKYANRSQTGAWTVDLKFMRDKFKGNVGSDEVPHLISFDRQSLTQASVYISAAVDDTPDRQIANVSREMDRQKDRIQEVVSRLQAFKAEYLKDKTNI